MKKGLKLVSLIVLGLFLMSFAMAQVDVAGETGEFLKDVIEFFKGAFNGIFEGLDFGAFSGGGVDAFAQFLLMLITVMLVYSVMDFAGFFGEGKGWINWVIAIAAGFLGFLYIDAGTIKVMAEQYKIMAIALNIILPWGIVMAFIWRLQLKAFEGEGKIDMGTAKVLGWVIGLSMIGYLWFKIINDSLFVGVIKTIAIVAIVAIIIFLFAIGYIMRHYLEEKGKSAMSGLKRRNRVELEEEAKHWADLIEASQKRGDPEKSQEKLKKEFDKLADLLDWDHYKL